MINLARCTVVVAAFLIAKTTMACEVTKEYEEARSLITKRAQDAYTECAHSVSRAKYWYRFVQCFKAGDAKNVGGGCGHIAGVPQSKYTELEINDEFCSMLKPSSKELKALLVRKGVSTLFSYGFLELRKRIRAVKPIAKATEFDIHAA